jgi:hypothetical protein
LADESELDSTRPTLLLPTIPYSVSRLIPPAQLKHVEHYRGVFTAALDRLYYLLPQIPAISEAETNPKPKTYLHYFTGTADYYICGYDGKDTMYGKAHLHAYPEEPKYRKFSLSNLKSNQFLELELTTGA